MYASIIVWFQPVSIPVDAPCACRRMSSVIMLVVDVDKSQSARFTNRGSVGGRVVVIIFESQCPFYNLRYPFITAT